MSSSSASCHKCEKVFTKRHSLNRHLREIHHEDPQARRGSLKCPSCSEYFLNNKRFVIHLEQMHEFISCNEKIRFKTVGEFKNWKSLFENKDKAKFVISSCEGGVTYYRCNRSGKYRATVTPENRKRGVKDQGSCKIGAHCPASIISKASPDDSVEVTVQKSHFGHEKELAHLSLDSAVRNSEDACRIDAWVNEENLKGAHSCVLFYKARGVHSEHLRLNDSDFMLVIMTPGQQVELQLYGEGVVCLDMAHGTNAYGYHATTLLVVDSRKEGFPCAFCISDRSDQLGLEIFLHKVKDRVGNIHPKVLMTDVAGELYNAWVSVMSGCEKHLFCTWHVLGTWDKKITAIKIKDKREDTSKILHTMLKETDPVAFQKQRNYNIKRFLDDPDTQEFGNYFRSHYSTNSEKWAYSSRLYDDIYVNMSLERFHGEFKHIFLLGKKAKRLDVTVHALIRVIERKLFQRIISNEKGKIEEKIGQIRTSHRASKTLKSNVANISNHSWAVSSSDSEDTYIVSKVEENCKCDLLCKRCNVCAHNYVCTCIDCSVHFNICKHIHYLCKFLGSWSEIEESSESEGEMELREPSALEVDSDDTEPETTDIAATLSKHSADNQSLEKVRKEIMELAESYSARCNSVEEVEILIKGLKSAYHTIMATRQSVKFRSPRKANARQKIEPQKKFVIRKKRKKADRAFSSKPTPTERGTAAAKALPMNSTPKNITISDSDLMQPVAMEIVIDNCQSS